MKRSPKLYIIISFVMASSFALSCTQKGLQLKNMVVRPSTVKNSAAYISIYNPGPNDEVLLSANSEGVGSIELHTMKVENEIMKMQHVENFKIPAGQTLTLKPGGNHLMLMGLKTPLKKDEVLNITLSFKNNKKIKVPFSVRNP